jgi:hypothetical protein
VVLSDRSDNRRRWLRGAAIARYYLFKGRSRRYGLAGDSDLIVTSDRTGASLPKRDAGSWKFLRAITLIPGSSNRVIGSHDIPMATIAHQGYYRIPIRNLDVKIRRAPLSGDQLLKWSTSSSR